MKLFQELLTSGALLGVGTILGMVLKYLLDKKKVEQSHVIEVSKLEDDWIQKEFIRLTKRIIDLETVYTEQLKINSENQRIIGRLSGEVEGLKSLLVELQNRGADQATSITADKIDLALQKTATAIQNSAEAQDKNTEKIDTAIQTANEAMKKIEK